MTFVGFINGMIIGIGTGAALIASSPDNPAIGIAVGVSLTIAFGLAYSKIKPKS